jgi:prepilin-type processing-associated H-X9-DG protein
MYAQDFDERYLGFYSGSDRKILLYPYTRSGQNNAQAGGGQVWFCPSTRNPAAEASYGFNANLNFVALGAIANVAQTVQLCDAGLNEGNPATWPMRFPLLSTHVFPPSTIYRSSIGRPNPRHQDGLMVCFMDGHVKFTRMGPPFYPADPSRPGWGNGITDPTNPAYANQLWDLN